MRARRMMGLLLLVVASLLLVMPAAKAAATTTTPIVWGDCPPDQSSTNYKTDCAIITYPLNYDDPSDIRTVNAFVRRVYKSVVTTTSLWMINGGPGDSTILLVPVCDGFIGMDESITCYAQDARGTGLSTFMSCLGPQPRGQFNPYKPSSVKMYDDCLQNIIEIWGDQLPYFSTYNAQRDLLNTVLAVSAKLVYIYAQSYGTYALNTYLQLDGARADAIVLDGPVPPNRWPLERNAEWTSQVAQDVAHECAANSTVCSDRISDMGHIPMLVMDAIVDGTLPCLSQLSWLSAPDGQFWASLYNNMLTGGGPERDKAHLGLAPFWHRLHRCSDTDIAQLKFYNKKQQFYQTHASPIEVYSFGLALNLGVSELYSFSESPMNYTQQLQSSSKLFASSGVELLVSYARNFSGWPIWEVNEAVYKKFAVPPCPVLILAGTLDANTENGLGFWFQEGLGSKATLLNVSYNSHVTVTGDNPCVIGIVLQFWQSLGTKYDASCLSEIPQPNWEGSSSAAQEYSMELFGTPDLWNDNYPTDRPVVDTCPKHNNECKECHTTAIVCGIVISLSAIIAALVGYIFFLQQKKNLSSAKTPMSTLEGVEVAKC